MAGSGGKCLGKEAGSQTLAPATRMCSPRLRGEAFECVRGSSRGVGVSLRAVWGEGGAILLNGAGPNEGVWPAGALEGHPAVGATNLDSELHRFVFT